MTWWQSLAMTFTGITGLVSATRAVMFRRERDALKERVRDLMNERDELYRRSAEEHCAHGITLNVVRSFTKLALTDAANAAALLLIREPRVASATRHVLDAWLRSLPDPPHAVRTYVEAFPTPHPGPAIRTYEVVTK